MKTLRIGTRGSALALAQTNIVREALAGVLPGIACEVVPIRTTGDILADASLDAIGGKGVFVKDIERELMGGSIDIAVHSLKDMQASLPDGLTIGAFLPREDPRDMLFSGGFLRLEDLPAGSRVGTSSMRRRCQLAVLRPDILVVGIRGNVATRLGRVGSSVDAVILASAGVRRLGMTPGVALDPEVMVPSPGQGIIAVECRADDAAVMSLLSGIDHIPTRTCAEAERSFLAALGQDCRLPAGALAELDGGMIAMRGVLGTPDCSRCVCMQASGRDETVGSGLARMLQDRIRGLTDT
ncbi:MAG TPA: hydroxymethylbilane synthase [Deltaproteobacteria bacterium]|nr:hydroxymethylbilane synthase [Deltaproteobacteria bacterium]